jgi:hypothetical protein
VEATLVELRQCVQNRLTVMKPKLGTLVSWLPAPGSESFAIRFRYMGKERTVELPLTPHTLGQLAVEATRRHVTVGELIAELITAMLSKNLIPQVLDNADPATDPIAGRGT